MLQILLSFGAVDALIPLLVIIILIAAAAGISRGYDIFSIFGIGVLAGVGGAARKGSFAGKTAFKGKAGIQLAGRLSEVKSLAPVGGQVARAGARLAGGSIDKIQSNLYKARGNLSNAEAALGKAQATGDKAGIIEATDRINAAKKDVEVYTKDLALVRGSLGGKLQRAGGWFERNAMAPSAMGATLGARARRNIDTHRMSDRLARGMVDESVNELLGLKTEGQGAAKAQAGTRTRMTKMAIKGAKLLGRTALVSTPLTSNITYRRGKVGEYNKYMKNYSEAKARKDTGAMEKWASKAQEIRRRTGFIPASKEEFESAQYAAEHEIKQVKMAVSEGEPISVTSTTLGAVSAVSATSKAVQQKTQKALEKAGGRKAWEKVKGATPTQVRAKLGELRKIRKPPSVKQTVIMGDLKMKLASAQSTRALGREYKSVADSFKSGENRSKIEKIIEAQRAYESTIPAGRGAAEAKRAYKQAYDEAVQAAKEKLKPAVRAYISGKLTDSDVGEVEKQLGEVEGLFKPEKGKEKTGGTAGVFELANEKYAQTAASKKRRYARVIGNLLIEKIEKTPWKTEQAKELEQRLISYRRVARADVAKLSNKLKRARNEKERAELNAQIELKRDEVKNAETQLKGLKKNIDEALREAMERAKKKTAESP